MDKLKSLIPTTKGGRIGGAVAVAFVLLLVIGLLTPQKKPDGSTSVLAHGTTTTQSGDQMQSLGSHASSAVKPRSPATTAGVATTRATAATPAPITTAPTTTAPTTTTTEPPPTVPPTTVAPTTTAPPTTAAPSTTAAPMAAALCGAPSNPYGYNYCGRGNLVYSPPGDVCSYFNCIGNFWNGSGYMEECGDGTVSMSGGRRGACSYHQGEQHPVDSGP